MEVTTTTNSETVTKTTIENASIPETTSMLKDVKRSAFLEDDITPPTDRYNLVYIIVLLHGIGMFFIKKVLIF